MSEMEDPRTFNKSLAMLQTIDTVLYLVSALLIYHYVGPNVQSPAISSLSPVMSKIAWGIAIPTVSPKFLNAPSVRLVLTITDHSLRCRTWPRCLQIHLRAHLPWLRQDA